MNSTKVCGSGRSQQEDEDSGKDWGTHVECAFARLGLARRTSDLKAFYINLLSRISIPFVGIAVLFFPGFSPITRYWFSLANIAFFAEKVLKRIQLN